MQARGIGSIRRTRSLSTRNSPGGETNELLSLYRLSTERDNVLKKLDWLRRQKDQAEKRLFEIDNTMHAIKQTVEKKAVAKSSVRTRKGSGSPFIQY